MESIAADLNLADSKAFAMQVCLEELMSNIVQHGQSRSGSKPTQVALLISIKIDAFVDRTVMTVEDNGRPFNVARARAKSINRPLDQIQPGGLGIHLIKSFASNVNYSRTAKGNRVVLEFMN
jgi:serine/threonine-protein kinase RsbW